MERCANAEALNAYMRTADQEERRLDAIERRKERMLQDEYAAYPGLVLEALAEAPENVGVEIFMHMDAASKEKSASIKSAYFEYIGRAVVRQVDYYREQLALRAAQNEINNASCQKCFDEGCRFCVE